MATPSQVDALLDDAVVGRVDSTDSIMHAQRTAVLMIQAGRRILRDLREAQAGNDQVMVALAELRSLRPSVRGRRTDLNQEAVAA